MKLIFLDVDGVLNRDVTEGGFEDECVEALKYIVQKSGAKIVLSSTWRYTEENTAAVREKLRQSGVFAEDDDFVGHTAHLGMLQDVPYFPTCNSHVSRTDEILLWIKCNTIPRGLNREDFFDEVSAERTYQPLPSVLANTEELFQKGKEWSMTGNWILEEPIELEQFIVLDDLPMLTEGCYGRFLKGHFIHTSMKTGLTMEQARTAVNILSSKFNFKKYRKNVYKACTNPDCLLIEKKEGEEDSTPTSESRSSKKNPQCLIS
eukprot:CAMPEP_0206201584 /NCGR_PEP_ID=MMETSP0166-20121206/11650_1 /ASSEMBLY_ACC=CAM_ASM_000260 /TAXON_ID=95228 /ORGANISM="Vannella robusta, Strain DIVA3 518/3/11/1/6" /LENGTH=261 /DNA_ID=CAMNT_0053620317 /DNA_START=1 /DNA_END=783 /DNA_ORIENTATION=+